MNDLSKSGLCGSRRRLLIVVSLVVIVIVLVSCFVVYRSLIDNSSIRVKNAAELRNAVNSVEVGVPVTIVFANDISLGPTLDIPVGADIILTSAGGRDFFRLIGLVGQNVITVKGKLTLDGIIVTHNGVEGIGVCVSSGGMFIMIDGEISGNNAIRGAGVLVSGDSVFEMSGGLISDNTATWMGGGVCVDGSFVMTGGEISGNTAIGTSEYSGGGGVGLWRGSFSMTGGTITNNTSATTGGGVWSYNGTINRSGGEISGNKADAAADVSQMAE